ncbi:FabD lysophospholipase-like protein [Mycena rosella]|uniref:FabD lysophospholipase-like protein n=1 Tax=Mycena rosella TaxID=1033263 RepID=A0AAD7F983_MYCRO|nr:FabD lysophospholipase-like protein [Mycena rosella]
MSTTVPATAPNLGVRVLSLDGGGIGTLSELLILDRMMYRIQTELRRDAKPSPCEYFELIGGSGTGGIVALMLGRLRMSIDEAISAYEKLRPQSNSESRKRTVEGSRPDACKTFVCAMNAVNMNGGRPELFRSYDTMDEPAIDCMLWEAARATSATPGLFKAVEIGLGAMKQRYVGGGVGHNNPTSRVLAEAEDIYPSSPVVFVASIGSGHSATIHIPNSSNPRDIAKAMKDITMDCEETHEANATRFRGLPDTYFRFNVQQGMQGLASHDWEKSNEVSAHTRNYLTAQDVKEKLSGAVKVILNPVIRVSAYSKICPAPSVRFTGRGGILEKMTEYFNRDIGRRHIFLLHGLGGSGKSQVAFKFVEQSESWLVGTWSHHN